MNVKKHIYVLGDSIAKGIQYNPVTGGIELGSLTLTKRLAKHFQLAVDNFSKYGATISKGLQIFERRKKVLKPGSLVILEFGGNDCNMPWDKVSQDPTLRYQAQIPLEIFETEYTKMLKNLQTLDLTPVLLNLPPLIEHRFLQTISRGLNLANIRRWLGRSGQIYAWQASYSEAVERIAESNNVCLIDIRSSFTAQKRPEDYMCMDGMHPNLKGQALIADRVITWLERRGLLRSAHDYIPLPV